ncbi:Uncharacterised protein [Corynebacterium renale]|nr:Uncharacterised protein [Corynebacterium renale]STD01724.1 Uncharacterised protein [Corynebacterium renale]
MSYHYDFSAFTTIFDAITTILSGITTILIA